MNKFSEYKNSIFFVSITIVGVLLLIYGFLWSFGLELTAKHILGILIALSLIRISLIDIITFKVISGFITYDYIKRNSREIINQIIADLYNSKISEESKNSRESKESKNSRESKESKNSRESKESKNSRESKESKESKDLTN